MEETKYLGCHQAGLELNRMIFTFISISKKRIGKLWVLNNVQKMDEGVKISVTYAWPIFGLILSATEVSPYTNLERRSVA